MKSSSYRPRPAPDEGSGLCDEALAETPGTDELWGDTDPEHLARRVTDPILASIKEELKKIDVAKYAR